MIALVPSTAKDLDREESRAVILVADDNQELRQAVVELLARRGFEVIGVADGQEALDVLDQSSESIEALITDLDMPRLDGFGLIERAIRRRPELRILLTTSRLPGRMPALSRPVDVLMKPYETNALVRWLRSDERAPGVDIAPGWSRIGGQPGGPGEKSSKARAGRRLAAAALLPLAFAMWLVLGPDRSALPAPPMDDVVRSATLRGLEPVGVMAEMPERWTWQSVSGATRYRLTLLDVTDRQVWQGQSDVPELGLPADLRAGWPPHVAHYLQVEAFAADGALLASTRGHRVRVVPSQTSEPSEEPSS